MPGYHKYLDMHVHLIGRGDGGTGCFISSFLRRSFSYIALIRLLGFSGAEDFDFAVRRQLRYWVESAGLGGIVLLAQDAVRNSRGDALWDRTQFYTPNDYVAEVCRELPHFFFGANIHPARPDAIREMERCVEMGAVLLKLHPVLHGIDLHEPAFRPYFRHAASLGLPILVHTGVINALFPRKRHAAGPDALVPVLDEGVTVVAGHSGRPTPLTPPGCLTKLRRLMERYPNLYTDTAALANPFVFDVLRRILSDGFWRSRLVHGSDFPVPPVPEPVTSSLSIRTCLKLLGINNPFLRDIKVKESLGCPAEIFERGWQILRK